MYAIIRDGGRQFKVQEGDELQIDYRGEELAAGTEIVFEEVLAAGEGAGLKIGRPTVAGAKVTATVAEPLVQGPKLVVQKFRRRKNSRRKTGHRQVYTKVKILSITA